MKNAAAAQAPALLMPKAFAGVVSNGMVSRCVDHPLQAQQL